MKQNVKWLTWPWQHLQIIRKKGRTLEVLFGGINECIPPFPIIGHHLRLQIQTLGLLANYHNSEADLGHGVIKKFVFV